MKDIDTMEEFKVRRYCRELGEENEKLREGINAKDELLICYRLGKRPSEKLFNKLDKLDKLLEENK